MGFGAENIVKRNLPIGDLFRHVEPDDLLKFGLIPELIGRLPIVSTLDELDEKALMRILTEPKNALVKQFKRLFEMDGVELIFEDKALQTIVWMAAEKKTGARALRSIMEEAMMDVMFELPSRDHVARCRVTSDVIQYRKKPVLEYVEKKRRASA